MKVWSNKTILEVVVACLLTWIVKFKVCSAHPTTRDTQFQVNKTLVFSVSVLLANQITVIRNKCVFKYPYFQMFSLKLNKYV